LIATVWARVRALSLLLAGPALSLPSMLVLRSNYGTQKTVVYCALVVVLSTLGRTFYGAVLLSWLKHVSRRQVSMAKKRVLIYVLEIPAAARWPKVF